MDTSQVDKLQELLARIQRNAAALSDARGAALASSTQDAPLDAVEAAPVAEQSFAPEPAVASEVPEADSFAEEPLEPSGVSEVPWGGDADVTELLEDDLLITIPPDAPDDSGPMQDTGEFELSANRRPPSIPPLDAEMEAPPISTRQQRGEEELDGLGVSLGFRPSQAPTDDEDEDDEDIASSSPRTPPPESGPQVTIPPKPPSDAAGTVAEPTMEQLGATIDLDAGEAPPADLELAADGSPMPSAAPDEFEADIPRAEYASAYHESLSAPPTARDDLDAHDQAQRERESRRSLAPGASTVTADTPQAAAPTEADSVVVRPPAVVSQPAAIYDKPGVSHQPNTFLERLDASLSLGPAAD